MFQRKNFLHAQISLHGTVQIMSQIAMLFAVQNLPGIVTCKRGLINIETDNLGIITTQEYNSLLPVDMCRSKHLCFISLLFRIHNTNYVVVKKP